jgi:hypothetical protein
MPDWTDTIANRRNGGVAGFIGKDTPLAPADTSPAAQGTVIVADGKGGYELQPPGTSVAAGTPGMKLTSGTIRPSSMAVADVHVMPGPSVTDLIAQLPWSFLYIAELIAQSDGTKVAQWNDLSGNARHFTNPTPATQPNFRLRVAKMGDRAVVEGDAAAGAFLRTAEWTTGTAQPNTIIAVGRIADVSQCLYDTANTSFVQRLSRASNGDFNIKASTATTLATPGDSRPHCFVNVYNGVTTSTRIDGLTVATGDAGNNSLRGLTAFARNDLGVPTGGYLGLLGGVDDLVTADQLSYAEWWIRNFFSRLQWAGI